MPIDFSKLMRPETPEEKQAAEERRAHNLRVSADKERFGEKRIRENVTVVYKGEERTARGTDDKIMRTEGDKGPINLNIDYHRTETPEFDALRQGVNRQLIAQEEKVGYENASIPLTVDGAFKKRNWKDGEGNWKSSWELMVTKISAKGLDENGKEKVYSAGYDVVKQNEKPQPQEKKAKRKEQEER